MTLIICDSLVVLPHSSVAVQVLVKVYVPAQIPGVEDSVSTTPNGIVLNSNTVTGNKTSVTLNDYEEGTWVPTIANGGGAEVCTGTYTRIGRSVTISGLIIFNSQSDTTQLTIQSFPFTVSSNDSARGGISVGYSTSSTYYTILMDDDSTEARVWGQGATGNPTPSSLSGTRVYFGGTYQMD